MLLVQSGRLCSTRNRVSKGEEGVEFNLEKAIKEWNSDWYLLEVLNITRVFHAKNTCNTSALDERGICLFWILIKETHRSLEGIPAVFDPDGLVEYFLYRIGLNYIEFMQYVDGIFLMEPIHVTRSAVEV